MNVMVIVVAASSALILVISIVLFLKTARMQDTIKVSITQSMSENMDRMENKLTSYLGNIRENYGEISTKLSALNEISNNTKTLKSYLTNPRARGKWGERMVEDIINLVGLQENINYVKQKTTEAGRPDFTFFLPNGKKINLDAKFSLDNYMRYIEAENQSDKEMFKKKFLEDVEKTIKDVVKRNYVNEETVDFAIVFIANEAVYSFILSEKPSIIDETMKNKIVLCSPNNLYAILSTIRQASKYYVLEKTSKEILSLLYKFNKEWQNFTNEFDKIDKAIDSLRTTFNKVSTTRKNKLDSVLYKIDETGRNVLPAVDKTEELKQ
jgi:DNA recombination protein RmuC